MNWKMKVLSHWKVAFLLLQVGLLAISIASGIVLAEPVDCPGYP